MDSFRYALAVLVVVMFLPAFSFWFLIHPFVARWRELGAAWAYAVGFGTMAMEIWALYSLRGALVGPDLGAHPVPLVLALAPLGLGSGIGIGVRLRLPMDTQLGLPELSPERHGTELITDGIYARLRHPRYVSATLVLAAFSLIANHLGSYLVLCLFVMLIHAVVLLEERELRQRFGVEYDVYSNRVPRYVPRLRAERHG